MHRLLQMFFRPSPRWSLATIFVAGGLAGIVFWGGFNTFMEYTNRLEFCIACHEMAAQPYSEYKRSVHFSNPSGVGAICSDCHVPRDCTAKLARKVQATAEIWYHFAGTIDTVEKFEAKRREFAERVWTSMTANDSHEYRNCHSYATMNFHKQSARAREKMEEAMRKGQTCIECHKGVAHKLPAIPHDD